MSGGSFDYLYSKVDDAADRLSDSNIPLHRTFSKHLRLVAKALHDIEWVYSCDSSPGSEEESIRKVVSKSDVIDCAREQAEVVLKQLQEALK